MIGVGIKAKYIKRTGSPGKYKYEYREGGKKPSSDKKKPKGYITPDKGEAIIRLPSEKQQTRAMNLLHAEVFGGRSKEKLSGGWINGPYISVPKNRLKEIVKKLKERSKSWNIKIGAIYDE